MTSFLIALAVIAVCLAVVFVGGVIGLTVALAAGLAWTCWKDPSNLNR